MPQSALIIAANGRVARRVVSRLHAAGQPPAALVRNSAKAQELLCTADGEPTYGKLIVSELTDEHRLARALGDVDIAFLALGSSPDQVALETRVVDAAARAGLPHLVKLSAGLADHRSPVSVLRVHAEIEDRLRGSGVSHTLLSPSTFMEIIYLGAPSIRTAGSWVGTAPAGCNALIDSADVVDATAAVLLDPGKRGGAHVLTGPEAFTWPDVAGALTRQLGRPITYRVASAEERTAQLREAGVEPWRIELLLGIDEINRSSIYAEPTTAVRELTGHEPRNLADFLTRSASLLKAE